MSRKNEQFKARDKKTHKMTRDGLVEVNQTAGTEQRVSQRGQDFELKRQAPPGQESGGTSIYQESSGRRHRQPTAPAPVEAPQQTGSQEMPGRYDEYRPGDRQYDPAVPQAPSGDIRPVDEGYRQNTASPGQSSPVPANADGGSRQPDMPLRPAQGGFHAQTAATIAATQRTASVREITPDQDGKRRHKQKQSQAVAHQQNDPEGPTAPRHTDTQAPQPTAAHRKDTAPGNIRPDPAPQASKRPSRLHFGETEQAPASAPGQRSAPARPAASRQHDTKYQRKFAADTQGQGGTSSPVEKSPADAPAPAGEDQRPRSDKLQFAAEEKPPEALGDKLTDSRGRAVRPDTGDTRLDKAVRRADKQDGKLGKAREKLPAKRRAQMERVYDEKKGKPVRKLHFEKEVKSQHQHLKGPLPLRPVKMGANAVIGFGHKKMYQVEHENVGTQAAHKGEIMAEGLVRSAYRFHKTRPYRRVARLERAATKAHIKLDYAKALHDNPKLKSNLLSRFLQKQKIKRQYAKAARDAKKAASVARKAGDALSRAFGAVVGFVRRHPMLMAGVLMILLLLFIIMAMFSSCSNMAGGGLSAIFMSSYLAEDKDIDDAELAYSQWETDLLLQAQNAEADRPGYDEYRYNVGDIGHDPFELMAYLTAKYQAFTFAEVEAELRAIFAEQYKLTFTEEIEVRYRTEYYYDDDGELQSEEVPYNWYILNVNLTARSFSDVVASRMSADERELFDLYKETKGNRQYTLSPFDFDWLPYVSCYYGWRVHPITGERDNHKAIDIAVAQNTEILATHDGVVQTATWHDSYGWYVALQGETDTGKTLVTKYAHCSTLLVSAGQEVKKGDVIARVGSTGDSTGPHLHFEVIVNGQYLNPLFFSEGAKGGEAAPGTPGGPDYPAYPGAPMDDAAFAAMMEEAQKHLGKPYVFGSSGPNTFDCSGFVSYVLAHSTHPGFGRTNAQGIYNQCTPVSPSEAKPGDLIFFHSTYSSPKPISHIGIYIGNGQMIHAGDPVGYASINSSYWQEHFYAFGRL